MITEKDLARFWSLVDQSNPDGCWPWLGSRLPKGYGTLTIGSRTDGTRRHVYAHRLAFELTNGPLGLGECSCHSCDNPPCCRPDHLFKGTKADNNADMDTKGRYGDRRNYGERNGRAKLTAEDVVGIRRRIGALQSAITTEAARYHVTPQLVRLIVQRRVWRQVP